MAHDYIGRDPWTKIEAGHYSRQIKAVRFDVVYDGENRLWRCRRNGVEFDAAKTLAEAKTFCRGETGRGRPLIDIL
jgi:hypothetical protein